MKQYKGIFLSIAICGACYSTAAMADDEAFNVPHVVTDEYGRCFAHSIPEEAYGSAGRTDVYSVGAGYPPGKDLTLTHSYDWFAQQIYISCNVSDGKGNIAPLVVQRGPWPRGHQPDHETLAIAFHYNGKTLAEYSTLDIAGGDPKNASCSVSHHTVIQNVEGFERTHPAVLFKLTTVDGRRLAFDALTGELLRSEEAQPDPYLGKCFADYPE